MTELDKAAQEHHVKYWFSEPSPSASFISGAEWMEKQMLQEMNRYASHIIECIYTHKEFLEPKQWREKNNGV